MAIYLSQPTDQLAGAGDQVLSRGVIGQPGGTVDHVGKLLAGAGGGGQAERPRLHLAGQRIEPTRELFGVDPLGWSGQGMARCSPAWGSMTPATSAASGATCSSRSQT